MFIIHIFKTLSVNSVQIVVWNIIVKLGKTIVMQFHEFRNEPAC